MFSSDTMFDGVFERKTEKSALNFDLQNDLSAWQEFPESKDRIAKMTEELKKMEKNTLELRVSEEMTKGIHMKESFFQIGAVEAYGSRDGGKVVFKNEKGIGFRVSDLGRLFVEFKNQPIGCLHHQSILSIKVA